MLKYGKLFFEGLQNAIYYWLILTLVNKQNIVDLKDTTKTGF